MSNDRDKNRKLSRHRYKKELGRLQDELVKFQEWIKQENLKVFVLFEGRDAAGKGGLIKRILEPLNPRYCRVVALQKPTEKELTQWYFQRYVEHLPSGGEIVILLYKKRVPKTVENFITLAQNGTPT